MIDTMLVNPHISDYICSLEPDLPEGLTKLSESAVSRGVPIIRKEAQSLIRFLLTLSKPKKILEIGTAIGFSACFMAERSPISEIVTMEKDPERISEAKEHIKEFGLENRITVLSGDAKQLLKEQVSAGTCYDFIFLDAAKAQYPDYLTEIEKLMPDGGILLTDNIFQEGSLSESKFSVTRRNRTIHIRMREYVKLLTDSSVWETVVLPVGDGMTVSVKKGTPHEKA